MLEVATQITAIITSSSTVAVIALLALSAIGVAALALVVVHAALRHGKSK